MNCIGPLIPDDLDLLTYADNEASPAVREHVTACPACQARVLRLTLEQRALQKLLHRAGCPPPLDLGEYGLGLMDERRTSELAQHLDLCPACRAEIADLTAFLASLRRPVAGVVEQAMSSLRTLVARLAPGPLGGPAGTLVPALRGPEANPELAPVVYAAEDILVTVDSWMERAGQTSRVLAGLVVGPADFTNAEARIDPEAAPGATPIDEFGNFLFSDVAPGVHHLLLRLPSAGIQIEIDELAVR